MTPRSSLISALCALACAPLTLGGCSGTSPSEGCTDVGCGPSFAREINVNLSEAQIQASSLEVCLNGTCQAGSFANWQAPTLRTGHGITFPDAAERESKRTPIVEAIFFSSTRGFDLQVRVIPWSQTTLKEGDVYKIRLFDTGGGQTHVEIDETVTYLLSYPNGPACGAPCMFAIGSGSDGGTGL